MICQKDTQYVGGCFLTRKGHPYKAVEVEKKSNMISILVWLAIAMVVIATLISGCGMNEAWADMVTEASWYDTKSCLREGTSGICADGRPLDDNAYSCAHPTEKFGTLLRVTRLDRPELSCIVVVRDRGPAKRLLRLGRSIDLSKAAAKALGIVESGHALVKIERVI